MISKLFKAIEEGNETTTKLLLDTGADIHTENDYGETPLHIATWEGSEACIEVLLDAGADKDKADEYGKTPLHIAAEKGHFEIVKLLLDAGVDKDKTDETGKTPLYFAVYYGHIEIVKLLLDEGVDIHKEDNYGETPLDLARACEFECVERSTARPARTWWNEEEDAPCCVGVSRAIYEGSDSDSDDVSYGRIANLLENATYKNIADKVLVAVSQQDIIFDTAFIIFKKTVKEETANVCWLSIDDTDTHNKLYDIFLEKFSNKNNH
jgi:ankyrin repeat protein